VEKAVLKAQGIKQKKEIMKLQVLSVIYLNPNYLHRQRQQHFAIAVQIKSRQQFQIL
jgi:hypothetical protein